MHGTENPTRRRFLERQRAREWGPEGHLDEFHKALGDPVGRGGAALRRTLHQEEAKEVDEALGALHTAETVDHPGIGLQTYRAQLARELADLVYIAYGTAHAFGIHLETALAEVHRANMTKVEHGERRADGKLMKPPAFVPPNMSHALLPERPA